MKQNLTDITIVLDRSGSMQSVRTDTIGGYNAFLEEQKKTPGDATLTLNQFDHEFESVHHGIPIQSTPILTSGTFVPRGNTALLDAIGRSINETGARLEKIPEADRPGKVVFVILTDGLENASHEFTCEKITEMIKHQTETYGWQFVFLGANQDAIKAGASMGVSAANAMTYAANSVGTTAAFTDVSKNLTSYRTGHSRSVEFSAVQREKQREAGAAVDSSV